LGCIFAFEPGKIRNKAENVAFIYILYDQKWKMLQHSEVK